MLDALLARRTSNIKSWTPAPSCPYIQGGKKEGAEAMKIIYKFRNSRLEVLHKKYLFWKFSEVFIARPVTVLQIGLHRGCIRGNDPKSVEQSFRYLWTAASVISLYSHRYLHVFPVHFHLNQSKSYGCSR